jgi:Ca2+-binding EF-hand superfamily protein
MGSDDNRKIAIADLVLKVAASERAIEVRRQQVCIREDFQAYAAFHRVCRDGHNALTPALVHRFLQDSTLDSSLRDCQAFVTRYDMDADGCLSFKEFLEAILPREHPELRSFVSQQDCFPVARDEYLSYDTECKLAKLIATEVGFFETLAVEKEAVLRVQGLTAGKIVGLVDTTLGKNLNFSNLQALFNAIGVLPYDAEIINFIRRLDKDGDGVITQPELADFLNEYRFLEGGHLPTGSRGRQPSRSNSPGTLSEERLRRVSPNRRIIEPNLKSAALHSSRAALEVNHTSRTIDTRVAIGRSDRSPLNIRQKEGLREPPHVSNQPASTSRAGRDRETKFNYNEKPQFERKPNDDRSHRSQITALNLNPPRENYRKMLESQIQNPRESPVRNRYHAEQKESEVNSRLGTSTSKASLYKPEANLQPRGTPVKRTTRETPENREESIDRLKISRMSPSREAFTHSSRHEETQVLENSNAQRNFTHLREERDLSNNRPEPKNNIFKQETEERIASARRLPSREESLRAQTASDRESNLARATQYREDDISDTKNRMVLGDHSIEVKSSETLYKAFKLVMNQERNLELARRELVAKSDFDVSEVFARIDKRNRSWFTIEDFRVFLSDIGLKNIETRALIDLYSSYDTNQSCLLNFEQLVSMICPLDNKYASYLNKTDRKVGQSDAAPQRGDSRATCRRLQPDVQRAKESGRCETPGET